MTLYMHVRYIFMYFEDYVEVAVLFFLSKSLYFRAIGRIVNTFFKNVN